jgi:hypothetical protein
MFLRIKLSFLVKVWSILLKIFLTNTVNLPTPNGTNVYFKDVLTNLTVYQMDCGWDPNIIYSLDVIEQFLKEPESLPIDSPTFCQFNIWNPVISSITTTPLTVGTIPTQAVSTTSCKSSLHTIKLQMNAPHFRPMRHIFPT